jgi:hypothetical protein
MTGGTLGSRLARVETTTQVRRQQLTRGPAVLVVFLDSLSAKDRVAFEGEDPGTRAGWDGHKRRKGSKTHAAVDTLGHLLALHVTPASAQERHQVAIPAVAVQAATGDAMEVAFVDQGDTGDEPARSRPPMACGRRWSSCPRPSTGSSC